MKANTVKSVIVYCYNSEIPNLRESLEPRLIAAGYLKVMYRNRQFYYGETEACTAIVANPAHDNELLFAAYRAVGVEPLELEPLPETDLGDGEPSAPPAGEPAPSAPPAAAPVQPAPTVETPAPTQPTAPARNTRGGNRPQQS